MEALIAVALLSVLAGIAVPSLSGWLEAQRLNKAARQLVTDLQFAKMKAVTETVQYQLRFENKIGRYTIERGDKATDSEMWSIVGPARELQSKDNPYYAKGVSLVQNFSHSRAIFSPGGTSNMGTAKLSIESCTDGKASCQMSPKRQCERCVTALLTGRIALVQ